MAPYLPQPPVPPFTQANLQTLAAAIATGATRVHFQDRTIEYASPSQMQIAYTAVYNALYPANGTGGAGPRRQYRMRSNKGL